MVLAASCAACGRSEVYEQPTEEAKRREAYRIHTLDAEGAESARLVSSRADAVFEDGFSKVLHDPPSGGLRSHAFRWVGKTARVRLKSHGDRRMHVLALGWFDEKALKTRAFMSFYVDGRLVGQTPPVDETGHYWGEFTVPAELLRDRAWVDLVFVPSAVAFHWAEVPHLTVAVLYKFVWEEVP
jgi:hypothetical protein